MVPNSILRSSPHDSLQAHTDLFKCCTSGCQWAQHIHTTLINYRVNFGPDKSHLLPCVINIFSNLEAQSKAGHMRCSTYKAWLFSHIAWTDKTCRSGDYIQNVSDLCTPLPPPPPLFVITQWHKDGLQIPPGMFWIQGDQPRVSFHLPALSCWHTADQGDVSRGQRCCWCARCFLPFLCSMCRWDPYARLTLMPFLHLYPLSLSISSLWKEELGLWDCWPCRRKLSSVVFMTCFTPEIKGQTSRDRGGSRLSPCYGCHGDVTRTHMLSLRYLDERHTDTAYSREERL